MSRLFGSVGRPDELRGTSMHRFHGVALQMWASATLLFVLGACGDPECPQGFYKDGKLCRRLDASVATTDAAVSAEGDGAGEDGGVDPDAARQTPESSGASQDAQGPQPDVGTSDAAAEGGA